MEETLHFALSGAVRSQDAAGLLAGVAAQGGASLRTAWRFIEQCALPSPWPPLPALHAAHDGKCDDAHAVRTVLCSVH